MLLGLDGHSVSVGSGGRACPGAGSLLSRRASMQGAAPQGCRGLGSTALAVCGCD